MIHSTKLQIAKGFTFQFIRSQYMPSFQVKKRGPSYWYCTLFESTVERVYAQLHAAMYDCIIPPGACPNVAASCRLLRWPISVKRGGAQVSQEGMAARKLRRTMLMSNFSNYYLKSCIKQCAAHKTIYCGEKTIPVRHRLILLGHHTHTARAWLSTRFGAN